MGKLIIKRSYEWNNRRRKFRLYIDGDSVGTISNGEIKEFNLEPGKHQLVAKIDWCQSNLLDFDLQESESRAVKLSGFKYGKLIAPLVLVGFIGANLLDGLFDLTTLVAVGLSPFLYPIYFITFGRKRYLRIE